MCHYTYSPFKFVLSQAPSLKGGSNYVKSVTLNFKDVAGLMMSHESRAEADLELLQRPRWRTILDPLIIFTKSSILDVAAALDPPLAKIYSCQKYRSKVKDHNSYRTITWNERQYLKTLTLKLWYFFPSFSK